MQMIVQRRDARTAILEHVRQPAVIRLGQGGRTIVAVVDVVPTTVHREVVRNSRVRLAAQLPLVGFGFGRGRLLRFGLCIGLGNQLIVLILVYLEHQVGVENGLHLLLEFQRRELQQPNCLLQLWRHGQRLTDAKLQRWSHWVPGRLGWLLKESSVLSSNHATPSQRRASPEFRRFHGNFPYSRVTTGSSLRDTLPALDGRRGSPLLPLVR